MKLLLSVLIGCLTANVCFSSDVTVPTAKEFFKWQRLPDLPVAVGGQFAGTSNDALIVAGGGHFPVSLFEGGQKVWLDEIYVLEPGRREWHRGFRLKRPLALGATVSSSDGMIGIGGGDAERHYAEVFRLRWADGRIKHTSLPDLPSAVALNGAALLGSTIYVAGGIDSPTATTALHNFWALDLANPAAGWRVLDPLPGAAGRILPVVAAADGAIYVVSGAELSAGADGKVVRRYLTDGYRYQPGKGWSRIADVPRPAVAAPVASYGQSHFLVFGGDDGAQAQRIMTLKDAHPGFHTDVLAYHTITNTWDKFGEVPAGLVTTAAVIWQGGVVIPSGEDRPAHRSPLVFSGRMAESKTTFGTTNYTVLVAYLTMNLLVGVYFAGRQKNTNDYFRGGQRIAWWAAGIAILGTMLSSLTFMAIPAKTFATDWTYILVNLAVMLIAPLVVFCYLPFYRRLNITSAYEYLEKRFNLAVRLFGSCAFILIQLGRMAIVLYLPALALSVVSDLNVYVCILMMGLLGTTYTMLGGAEAVTWTEVLQFFVLFGAAILSLVLIAGGVDGGAGAIISIAAADAKFNVGEWSWDYTTTSVGVVLIGNLFAQLIPYTTDQSVIQRYLTTPTERQAARAIWLNALFTIPASLIFFSIGTALYVFYKQQPQLLSVGLQTDAIFPWFIVNEMPIGISGLVIAGLFAAGQTGAQNSIATAIVTDFYKRFHPAALDSTCLRLARWLTAALGIIGVSTAMLMATYPIKSMWDVFLTILGLFGGSLAGTFALGIFTRRAHSLGACIGIVTSVVTLLLVQQFTSVHFFLYAAIGIITCFTTGYIVSVVVPARQQSLAGLTIYTLGTRQDAQPQTATELVTS